MFSYKINNSYTVYVSWDYYNQVKKITKKCKQVQNVPVKTAYKKPDVIVPLSVGAGISSKAYGTGTLKSKDSNGVIAVQFREKLIKFMYPMAFQLGSLAVI